MNIVVGARVLVRIFLDHPTQVFGKANTGFEMMHISQVSHVSILW